MWLLLHRSELREQMLHCYDQGLREPLGVLVLDDVSENCRRQAVKYVATHCAGQAGLSCR